MIHSSATVSSNTESSCLANARACNCASGRCQKLCTATRGFASHLSDHQIGSIRVNNFWERGLIGDSPHELPKILDEFIFNLLLYIMNLLLTRTAHSFAINLPEDLITLSAFHDFQCRRRLHDTMTTVSFCVNFPLVKR